ncbi:MAG: hypothetical protein AB1591_09480 [Pseudomonadota bacterium]
MKTLFTLVESPFSPHFPELYRELDIESERFDSARNLHRALQKRAPDFFVGEFIYGWCNDYAGNTVGAPVGCEEVEATKSRVKSREEAKNSVTSMT